MTPGLDAIFRGVGSDPYRLFTLVLALAFLAVRAYFRWRAGTYKEAVASRHEGTARGFARSVVATAARVLVLLWVLFPGLLSFADVALPDGARVTGTILGALGQAFSATLVVRHGAPLVTTGPYARVRHPMYVAFLLLVVGLALTTANMLVGAVGLGAVAFVMMVRTPREERMMLDAHGEAWRAYASRTGRFVPRLGS